MTDLNRLLKVVSWTGMKISPRAKKKQKKHRRNVAYEWIKRFVGWIIIFVCLVFPQLYNEDVHRTLRAARDSTWPTAPTRTTASPTCPASFLCCCVPSPTPHLATGPSACRETTWWASRTSASWRPGCSSVRWSGPRTSLSSLTCSSWIRWVRHFYGWLELKNLEGNLIAL